MRSEYLKVSLLIVVLLVSCYAITTAKTESGISQEKGSLANDTAASCEACQNLPKGVFCEDFCSGLDMTKWWYGRSQWGNGKQLKNNGVIPENVIVNNNRVYFAANGDQYSGSLKGVRKKNPEYFQDQPGTRTGGIIITDEYFGSGSYEVRMRLPKQTGVCTAIWTFWYKEVYQDDPSYDKYITQGYQAQGSEDDGYYVTINHEIDIEIPTAPKTGDAYKDCTYEYARLNTWIGEENYTDNFQHMGFNMSDGKFHTYRFDWHTGGNGQEPRVDFYLDNKFIYTCKENIPFIKGRLTLGTWFPQWAGGAAAFDRVYTEVDWVKITPFNEPNDKIQPESFKNAGMTKCYTKAENDKYLPKCKLVTN